MRRISLRTLIFWPHLIAGVSAGLVILLMSVTGVLLTYERQMIAWADRHYRSAPPAPDAQRLSAGTLLERFTQQSPGGSPTTIAIGAAPDAPAVITAPPRTFFVDAYTGQVLGAGSQRMRAFMSGLRSWHRWIAVDGPNRPIARAITGWSNFIFLFIVVSGFYLWFPRTWTWRQIKPTVVFNARLRGKPRDFNWHNVIGVWSAPILFIVVLTAMPISFPWASALIYRAAGEAPPAPAAAPAWRNDAAPRMPSPALDAAWQRGAAEVAGWKTISVRVPAGPAAPVVVTIDEGTGGQPQLRSTLTLNGATGAVTRYERFEDQTAGRRARSISRFAHTGEVLGFAGQTVAGLASAGGVVLVWTGLALAWRRLRAWLKRRAAQPAPLEVAGFAANNLTVGEDR